MFCILFKVARNVCEKKKCIYTLTNTSVASATAAAAAAAACSDVLYRHTQHSVNIYICICTYLY